MNEIVKQRIVGAVVLIALAVIFVPLIFTGPAAVRPKATVSFKVPSPPTKPVLAQRHKDTLPAPRPERIHAPLMLKAKPAVKTPRKRKTVVQPVEAWVVQIASFTRQGNASSLAKALQTKGYPAYEQAIKGSKGEIIRILVGPEVKRVEAEALLAKLSKDTKMKGIVIPYHPINT